MDQVSPAILGALQKAFTLSVPNSVYVKSYRKQLKHINEYRDIEFSQIKGYYRYTSNKFRQKYESFVFAEGGATGLVGTVTCVGNPAAVAGAICVDVCAVMSFYKSYYAAICGYDTKKEYEATLVLQVLSMALDKEGEISETGRLLAETTRRTAEQ